MKSKIIAISAIAAGLTAIILTVGIYVELFDLFALVISSAFVILPIYFKSYKGCIMSYLVGGILAMMFGGFNFFSLVLPSFFFFFGLYPVLSLFLRERKVKKWIYILIGLLWCVIYFYGAFFYYTEVMGLDFADFPTWLNWIEDYILIFIAVFGVVFYFIYDRYVLAIRLFIDKYLRRIIK